MIRARVLRALALNREPGFHFAGNFCGVSFERTDGQGSRVTLEAGTHCVDADGQVNLGAAAMLADMALAAAIRAHLHPSTRLATVSLAMQLTGARLAGRLEAAGEFHGFIGAGHARQGLARGVVTGAAGPACLVQGAFMSLDAPPGVALFPLPHGERTAPEIAPGELTPQERKILRHADATLAQGEADFARRFWGFEPRRTKKGATCAMKNGAHVANRVGHAQGGLMMGLAAATACAALPSNWVLSGISAYFVSPGQGAVLRAQSTVIHHGLLTAVVRTAIAGPGRRRVLQVLTSHARVG